MVVGSPDQTYSSRLRLVDRRCLSFSSSGLAVDYVLTLPPKRTDRQAATYLRGKEKRIDGCARRRKLVSSVVILLNFADSCGGLLYWNDVPQLVIDHLPLC